MYQNNPFVNLGIEIGIGTDTTNVIISTFTRSIGTKPSRVMTWNEGTPPTKSGDASISWSHDKSKIYISTFTRLMDPKFSRVVT